MLLIGYERLGWTVSRPCECEGGGTPFPEIWYLVELLSNDQPISLHTTLVRARMAYDIRFPRHSGQGGKLRTFLRLRGLHGRKQLLRPEISWDDPAVGSISPRSRGRWHPYRRIGVTVAPGRCYSDLSLYCREGLCGRRVQVQIRRPLISGYNSHGRLSMLMRLARSCTKP